MVLHILTLAMDGAFVVYGFAQQNNLTQQNITQQDIERAHTAATTTNAELNDISEFLEDADEFLPIQYLPECTSTECNTYSGILAFLSSAIGGQPIRDITSPPPKF
jgi:hypothetical protein